MLSYWAPEGKTAVLVKAEIERSNGRKLRILFYDAVLIERLKINGSCGDIRALSRINRRSTQGGSLLFANSE